MSMLDETREAGNAELAKWPASLAQAEERDAAEGAESAQWGHYVGLPIVAELLEDGRQLRIKQAMAYVQADARTWPVPAGAVVDGASIPRAFWSLIGGPLEGRYRNASVVHDYHCDTRTQPWKDTHRAFHMAMRCSGVGRARAKILYYAVYRFGPRWEVGGPEAIVGTSWTPESFDARSFNADADAIARTDPDLDEIELMADARAAVGQAGGGREGAERMASEASLFERLLQLQDDDASREVAGRLLARYADLVRDDANVEMEAGKPTLDALRGPYRDLFNTCQVRPERAGEVEWHRRKVVGNKARYQRVEAQTGVPWWFIGIVHAMEASLNFNGHLHNGDPLSAKTVQDPPGRPTQWNPPNDWESSAIDALAYEKMTHLADWDVGAALYRFQSYNGWGYHYRGVPSPYLWSYSTRYSKGKFVKDHVYDANAVSKQCGAGVILRALVDSGDVAP